MQIVSPFKINVFNMQVHNSLCSAVILQIKAIFITNVLLLDCQSMSLYPSKKRPKGIVN